MTSIPLPRQALRDNATYLLALTAPILANFTLVPAISAHFGQEAATTLIRATVFGGMAGMVLSGGLPGPMTRDIATRDLNEGQVEAIRATFRSILTLSTLACGCFLAVMPNLVSMTALIAVSITGMLWVQALARAQRSAFRFAGSSILAAFLSPTVGIFCLLTSHAAVRIFAMSLTSLMVIIVTAPRRGIRREKVGTAVWKRFVFDGIPTVPHTLALIAIGQMFRLTLTYMHLSGDISHWNALASLALSPGTLFSMLNQVTLAEFFERSDSEGRHRLTTTLSSAYLSISLASSLGLLGLVYLRLFGSNETFLMAASGVALVASTIPQGMYLVRVNYLFAKRTTYKLLAISPAALLISLFISGIALAIGDVMLAALGPFFGYAFEQLALRWSGTEERQAVAPLVTTCFAIVGLVALGIAATSVPLLPNSGHA